MLKSYLNKNVLEAGCDEAGRGALAGPVYAAAVILPKRLKLPLLNDSKKLTAQVRNRLRRQIEAKATAWAIGTCSEREIEKYNILNCSILAMQRAVQQLSIRPEHLLIDGNRFKPFDFISYTTVVKGDSIYKSIAAASILAKTHRDEYMIKLAQKHPAYEFELHKGYGTQKHIQAIKDFGYLDCHRKTFRPKSLL